VAEITGTISINDKAAQDLFPPLVEMVVEEDHRMAAVFRIKLSIRQQEDGHWTYLDDDRIKVWNKVTITANTGDQDQKLITGYITHLKPHFEADENNSLLEICGMDPTSPMSIEEKIKDWPNKTDSDIASAIFKDYNLKPQVDETSITHDDTVSTIIQRETDIQFLKRLARRNGFECFAKHDTGYFRKPVLTDPPQPVLAVHFGSETNMVSFEGRINALRPTAVEMHQIDTIGKQLQDSTVESGSLRQLGRDSAATLSPPGPASARLFVRQAVATGEPEMKNLVQAVFDEAAWLIQASGEIDSTTYGSVLQTKQLVPIKGVGELFSGLYYVTNVKHTFTMDSYTQQFTARRNAMAPTSSDFGSAGSLLGALG
jgi:phage protein D